MALNQQGQAFEIAKDMLKSSNKTQFGTTEDYLVSILESSNSNLSLGNKLTEFLNGLEPSLNTILGVGALGTSYDKNELKKYQKIEDKVAYLVSLVFTTTSGLPALSVSDHTMIKENIGRILERIANHFSQDEKINESDIVVMSALSNFKVSISREEKIELEQISKKIKKLLKDNDFENAFGEISEEPVQRIQKLKTIIALLEQKGLINSDTTQVVSDFKTKFVPKLKELNEFNEEYYKLDNARTIFYKIDAKYGKVNILSTKDQAKFEETLKELGVEDIESYITTLYGQLGASESREAKDKILDRGLGALKKNAKFRKTLREKKIKQPDFEKMYLSHFSLQLIERAREGFHGKKNAVFGDNESSFDESIINWRKLKRDKIVDLFGNNDIVGLQNIYNNDSKVFFQLADDDGNNQNVMDALNLVISHQYSSLAVKEQKSLVDHILARNNANTQLYYGKPNEPIESKLKRQEMTLSALSMVGKTGSFLNKKAIVPSLKFFARTAEITVGTVIGKGIFGTIAKTSVGVENLLKKANAKITKKPVTWRGKILKSPALLALPVTKMLEWGGTATNWTGKQTAGRLATGINMANEGINNQVKKWSNNEINTWFEGILVGGISKGALGWGVGGLYEKQIINRLDEKMSRDEKENVISDFYDKLADGKPSVEVARILEGLDVAQKVNDSHPYIFDKVEEGVKVTDETKEEKEKLSKDTLEKMLEQITKVKGNITLEKDSQNKYIAEVMKQLEKKFGEIENIINGKGKFEDKLEKIKWVFNKIISDLGDGGSTLVMPVISGTTVTGTKPTGDGEICNLNKKRYDNEVKKLKLEIDNKRITDDIAKLSLPTPTGTKAPDSASVATISDTLYKSLNSNNDKLAKIEEDNSVLEDSKDRLEKLIKTGPSNKFSEIIKGISDDSSAKKVIKNIKDEYAKNNTTGYNKTNLETQLKSLVTELSQIDIS